MKTPKKKIAGLLTLTALAGTLAGTSMADTPMSAPAAVSDYVVSGAQVEATNGKEVDVLPLVVAVVAVAYAAGVLSGATAAGGGCLEPVYSCNGDGPNGTSDALLDP